MVIRKPIIEFKRQPEPTPEPYSGHLKPFASDLRKVVDIQNSSKYLFKPNDTPAPGSYDADESIRKMLFKSPSAVIVKDSSSSPLRELHTAQSSSPDPYTGHIKPFGADSRNIVFAGNVSPPKPDNNPGPGAYDFNAAKKFGIIGGPYISHADDYEDRNYGGDPVNLSVQNPYLPKLG